MKQFLEPLLAQIRDERRLLGTPERWAPLRELFRRDIQTMLEREELTHDESVVALQELEREAFSAVFAIPFPGKHP